MHMWNIKALPLLALKLYIWPKVNVSESMSNFKVKVHITVKKVSLGLQIMFNMKALSTLIQNLKVFWMPTCSRIYMTSYIVLPKFLVLSWIFTQIHNCHIFNVTRCFKLIRCIT